MNSNDFKDFNGFNDLVIFWTNSTKGVTKSQLVFGRMLSTVQWSIPHTLGLEMFCWPFEAGHNNSEELRIKIR